MKSVLKDVWWSICCKDRCLFILPQHLINHFSCPTSMAHLGTCCMNRQIARIWKRDLWVCAVKGDYFPLWNSGYVVMTFTEAICMSPSLWSTLTSHFKLPITKLLTSTASSQTSRGPNNPWRPEVRVNIFSTRLICCPLSSLIWTPPNRLNVSKIAEVRCI